MRTLLQLLIRNGGFVTFVLVEMFCFYLIVQFNKQQNAIFTHTAGVFGGYALEKRQQALDYISLNARVDSLLKENALLHAQLADARVVHQARKDTSFSIIYDTISHIDSVRHRMIRPEYGFIPAQAISNSISISNNWLMLNKGKVDGIAPNMAVVSRQGIVGIVRHVQPHFCMVMSILHRQTRISAALPKHEYALGELMWEGGDPTIMTLRSVPKHHQIKPGEPVVTSGMSLMFPRQVPIGTVEGEPERDAENPYFLQMRVKLSQDMSAVRDVYIVNNLFSAETDSLKVKIKNEQ